MNEVQFNEYTLQALITRREAMIADNKECEREGKPLAWSGSDFRNLENEILTFRNER